MYSKVMQIITVKFVPLYSSIILIYLLDEISLAYNDLENLSRPCTATRSVSYFIVLKTNLT